MSLKRLQEGARYMLTSWLVGMGNMRMKRLTSIASLFAYVKGSTEIDSETIAKMNAVMALASDESAMTLPIHLSKVIWCDRNGKPLLSMDVLAEAIKTHDSETISSAISDVVAGMPEWLRYSGEADMKADLEKFFNVAPSLIDGVKTA